MLDLVERLEALAAVDRNDTEDWETVLFCELGSTPLLWPLDDVWLEILFQWAGVDLVDADDVDLDPVYEVRHLRLQHFTGGPDAV